MVVDCFVGASRLLQLLARNEILLPIASALESLMQLRTLKSYNNLL